MRKKVTFFVRGLIARLLDRHPKTCWANLAYWWCYPQLYKFWEIFNQDSEVWAWNQLCRVGSSESAWCGKCERTGRFWRTL